jgi:hypothetical protein
VKEDHSSKLGKSKRTVTVQLPKVCDWFHRDFGDGSAADCLQEVLRFLPEASRVRVAGVLAGRPPQEVKVKFLRYEFTGRSFLLPMAPDAAVGDGSPRASRSRAGTVEQR